MLDTYPRLPGQSLKDYVRYNLEQNIVRLRLKPGERLVEADIGSLLNVSRTPVREAILELAEKNLIDILPRNGTFVSYINMDIVSEFLYLRTVIERDLSRLACECITSEETDLLHENIAIQKYYYEVNKPAKLLEYDIKFHSEIYRICKKDFIDSVVTGLAVHFNRIRYLSMTKKEFILKISEHEDFVRALEARDAARAMEISDLHMIHTYEDYEWIKQAFPQYLQKP